MAGLNDAREEDIAAVDGLASGFDSFVGGIVDGVTTRVQAPVRGAEGRRRRRRGQGRGEGRFRYGREAGVVGVADAATDVLRGIRDTTDDVDADEDEDRRVLDLLRDSVSLQKRPARALYGRERALRAYSYGGAGLYLYGRPPAPAKSCLVIFRRASTLLERVDLGNASELVVSEGAVALLRENAVEFVAPASLVLGCKREKSGEAVVLIAAAAPTSGEWPSRRGGTSFPLRVRGARGRRADAGGAFLARRALEAVLAATWTFCGSLASYFAVLGAPGVPGLLPRARALSGVGPARGGGAPRSFPVPR